MSSVTITFDGTTVTPETTDVKKLKNVKFVNDNSRDEEVNFPEGESPFDECHYTIPANGHIKLEAKNAGNFTFSFYEDGGEDPSGEIIVTR